MLCYLIYLFKNLNNNAEFHKLYLTAVKFTSIHPKTKPEPPI